MMVILHIFVGLHLYVGCFAEDYDYAKEEFFKNLRANDLLAVEGFGDLSHSDELPVPGGFTDERLKRSYHVLPSRGLTSHFVINANVEKGRIKRELTTTEQTNTTVLPATKDEEASTSPRNVVINDFIRFKRDASGEELAGTSRLKREPELKTEKLILDPGTEREPRGATKEQWIKQPYPVERPIDDNIPSASDNIRAPRVHFVTQRRQALGPESRDLPPLQPAHRGLDEREGRSRDFDPYPYQQQRPYHYPYPRPRSYDTFRPRFYDPYFEPFDSRRHRFDDYELTRYKNDERQGRPLQQSPPPPLNKQRRIIYYATLPEVVRNPKTSDSRYRYYPNFEDRYVAPVDTYRIRKPYSNLQKQRDLERTGTNRKKTPLYPVTVSTDVNVKEPKKNPERRIFSEVGNRYIYKAPSFETAEDDSY